MRLHRPDAKLELLSKVPLFAACSKTELQAIAHVSDEVDLPEGHRLTEEGASGREFILIIEGTAAVSKNGQPLATLGAGDFVGEIALIADVPRTATVVATSPVRALVVAWNDFHSVYEHMPSLAPTLLQALGERLHHDAL